MHIQPPTPSRVLAQGFPGIPHGGLYLVMAKVVVLTLCTVLYRLVSKACALSARLYWAGGGVRGGGGAGQDRTGSEEVEGWNTEAWRSWSRLTGFEGGEGVDRKGGMKRAWPGRARVGERWRDLNGLQMQIQNKTLDARCRERVFHRRRPVVLGFVGVLRRYNKTELWCSRSMLFVGSHCDISSLQCQA